MSTTQRSWFCESWKDIKSGLLQISTVSYWWVKVAIAVVIIAGDTAHKKICSHRY